MSACPHCGEDFEIGDWPFCRSRTNPEGHAHLHNRNAQISDRDAIVLWEHPVHGVRWPGKNDSPMPKAYEREGFQRVEYKGGLADVRRIEKKHKVISEIGNYDRGSGAADRE